MTEQMKEYKNLSPREQATELISAEIVHWKHLEKGLGVDMEFVKKKIGGLQFVQRVINGEEK